MRESAAEPRVSRQLPYAQIAEVVLVRGGGNATGLATYQSL
jgi:hypothetical protein